MSPSGLSPRVPLWSKALLLGVFAALAAFLAVSWASQASDPTEASSGSATKVYLVNFAGVQTLDGTFQTTISNEAALALIQQAGGSVQSNLLKQVGVVIVTSPIDTFDEVLRASPFVEDAAEDFAWKGVMTYDEAVAAGGILSHPGDGGGGPEVTADPLQPGQWDMMQIRAPEAHATQAGWRAVDVGVLDTGIDGEHLDFKDDPTDPGSPSNVDCSRGRNSIVFGPGIGNPDPCVDNGFHGTHVAGTIAAQANNHGVVGVAPNVTLVPVKVCDTAGFCYAFAVVDGITYAGDQRFDVINMSFFVDDDELLQSTEYKCMDDPVQRTFRRAVERAIQYARSQGVTPIAALGNSDDDLAHPPEPNENNCDVVPAESSGVIGTMALGRNSQKAGYSNYGSGATDVAAPGGAGTTGDCTTTVLSTFPAQSYFCIQGTSMASPHSAGVAALIVSQYGKLVADNDDDPTTPPLDVDMSPTKVENYLQSTTVDIGLSGYDECFGNGRIDALRAVLHQTSKAYDATAPFCPEYDE